MTRDDTKKIIYAMMYAYPNYKPVKDNSKEPTKEMSKVIDLWTNLLEAYPYQQISAALQAYILTDTSGFAPSIGQLTNKIHTETELGELEAWALVSKALRNGYYGAEMEFEKLPPLVQKAIGNPSNLRQWSQTDSSNVETVLQSNFIRNYRTEVKRANELSKLPENVKSVLLGTANNALIESEE
jgi:hypothetical protein